MKVEDLLQVACPLSDFRDRCAFRVGGCRCAGWWGGWPWIVWIEELGSQSKHARQEAGEVLHSARGAHLEGHRIGDVEQVPCGRQIKQVVDDTIDGFKVCGSKKGSPSCANANPLTHIQQSLLRPPG